MATGALRALRLKAQPETNRKRRTWGKVLGTGEEDEESGEVVNLHQLEKFQMVLKKQAEALVQLGFDPSVKVGVGMDIKNVFQGGPYRDGSE